MWGPSELGPGEREADLPEGYEHPGKWKVFSDGSGGGTRLIDPFGREVPGIFRITFDIEAGGVSRLEVAISPGLAEMTHISADQVEFEVECPVCGEAHTHKCGPPF